MSHRWEPKWTLRRLFSEPPFRIATQAAVAVLPCSIRHKAAWDVVDRPEYLTGIMEAADQANREGISRICVVEFGVGGGDGLIAMQEYAASVESETAVMIEVFGCDTGKGLPRPCGDYRDHPDCLTVGDFPMDPNSLRNRLKPRTQLVLGDVRETLAEFVSKLHGCHIGFVSVDLDYYSSASAALKIFTHPSARMLARVPVFFDDIDFSSNHEFAGQLLAIREFNKQEACVKIDRWRGLSCSRPFAQANWLRHMYLAHRIN